MSAFTIESARAERATAVQHRAGIRVLDVYVRTSAAEGLDNSFPVSGDMLAMLQFGKRSKVRRRRRHAARVCAEHEGVA